MRYFFTILIAFFLIFAAIASSEIKEIIAEGTYSMVRGETQSVAESRAILNAKRFAIEQAGDYVESYSKIKNLQLTEDEIKVLASAILEITVADKKRTTVGDNFYYWIRIKAKVNLDRIEEMAGKIKEKYIIEDYRKILDGYENSQAEIERLKRQLALAKDEKERKQIEAKIAEDEKSFQENEWFDKGYKYIINKEYDEAIDAYTSAIGLQPGSVNAYFNRGSAYFKKEKYDKALEDFHKAVTLNTTEAEIYGSRSTAYSMKDQYERTTEDLNNIIAQKPDYALAYSIRGAIYRMKGKYNSAIEDYNKAISLDLNNAETFAGRGIAYFKKGQYERAIEDFSKAIVIKPNDAFNYLFRGNIYSIEGITDKAIFDFQKACSLKNEHGCKVLKAVSEGK